MGKLKTQKGYLVQDLHTAAEWTTCPGCGRLHLCLSKGLTCAKCLLDSQMVTLRLVAALSSGGRGARGGTIVYSLKVGAA